MYRDFAPVAVLDWEMAALGPRELDVAWLIYGHRIFEDIANSMSLPGMPDFLRPDDVAANVRVAHRVTRRATSASTPPTRPSSTPSCSCAPGTAQVHFGEVDEPDDVDDLVMNREPLERMLAGSYWNW